MNSMYSRCLTGTRYQHGPDPRHRRGGTAAEGPHHGGPGIGPLRLGHAPGGTGNSGVILSLIFRGFSRAMKDKDTMDGIDLADALNAGVVAAYKAVMKPAEGTVLHRLRLRGTRAGRRRRKTPPLSMCWDRPLSGPGRPWRTR